MSASLDRAHAPVIVIAVDEGPSGDAALRWAASLSGTWRFRAVTPYQRTYVPSEITMLSPDAGGIVERSAQRDSAAAIERAFGSDADIEHVLAAGPLARVVLDHADDAAMVVVGVAPRAWWRRSPVGRLASRLACPLVAVPVVPAAAAAHPAVPLLRSDDVPAVSS